MKRGSLECRVERRILDGVEEEVGEGIEEDEDDDDDAEKEEQADEEMVELDAATEAEAEAGAEVIEGEDEDEEPAGEDVPGGASCFSVSVWSSCACAAVCLSFSFCSSSAFCVCFRSPAFSQWKNGSWLSNQWDCEQLVVRVDDESCEEEGEDEEEEESKRDVGCAESHRLYKLDVSGCMCESCDSSEAYCEHS